MNDLRSAPELTEISARAFARQQWPNATDHWIDTHWRDYASVSLSAEEASLPQKIARAILTVLLERAREGT